MKSLILSGILLGAVAIMNTGCASPQVKPNKSVGVWYMDEQLNINHNPSGVWKFGTMNKDLTNFSIYTSKKYDNRFKSMLWQSDTQALISVNKTNKAVFGVNPGQLLLHPASNTNASVLRWTAPSDGTYNIKGDFSAGDKGIMLIGVLQSGNVIAEGKDSGVVEYKKQLKTGDTIDFLVHGGYSYGSTALDVVITKENIDKK